MGDRGQFQRRKGLRRSQSVCVCAKIKVYLLWRTRAAAVPRYQSLEGAKPGKTDVRDTHFEV